MFPLYLPDNNRNYTSGFLRFSEGAGWENFPEMDQSLTWFIECRGFFG